MSAAAAQETKRDLRRIDLLQSQAGPPANRAYGGFPQGCRRRKYTIGRASAATDCSDSRNTKLRPNAVPVSPSYVLPRAAYSQTGPPAGRVPARGTRA